jgi:hypothetical protein
MLLHIGVAGIWVLSLRMFWCSLSRTSRGGRRSPLGFMGFLVNVIWKSPLRVTINQFDLLSEEQFNLPTSWQLISRRARRRRRDRTVFGHR